MMKELEKIVDSNGVPMEIVDAEARADISEIKQSLSDLSTLTKTASGAIATFDDGSALPMPKLEVAIEPQQEGSGDPSPTNIRPISGWSAVDVTRCGKNLIPYVELGVLSQTDGSEESNTDNKRTGFIRTLPNTQYTISGLDGSGISIRIFEYKKDKNYIRNYESSNITNSVTIQTGAEVGYIRFQGNKKIFTSNVAQCEKGTTSSAYKPYNGTTYTIDLDGTRYGGKVDLISGVLTVNRVSIDLGTLNWTYASTQKVFYDNLPTNALNVTNKNGVCEGYRPTIQQTIDMGTWSRLSNGEFVFAQSLKTSGRCAVAIKDLNYTDTTEFKSSVNGMKMLYPLATPQSIQLTPTQVNSLLGVNNIWADSGDLELTYFVNNSLVQAIYDMVNVLTS